MQVRQTFGFLLANDEVKSYLIIHKHIDYNYYSQALILLIYTYNLQIKNESIAALFQLHCFDMRICVNTVEQIVTL
jgi:hypothetical protein